MNKVQDSRLIVISERVYAILLVLYPAAYRREYGRYMLQVFRDICRDTYRVNGSWGMVNLWVSALFDLLISVIEQHRQEEIRMPTAILGRFNGLILMIAGALMGFTSISQLQPGSHYIYYGLYQMSIFAFAPGCIALCLGLVGFYVHYGRQFNRSSTWLIGVSVLAAIVAIVSVVANVSWNLFIMGWLVHFFFLGLFGFSLRRQHIFAPYNIFVTLLGAIPFLLLLVGLIISRTNSGVEGPQLGPFALLIGLGVGWFIVGYRVHIEKMHQAPAIA